jgi:hypothetical protein
MCHCGGALRENWRLPADVAGGEGDADIEPPWHRRQVATAAKTGHGTQGPHQRYADDTKKDEY